MTDPLVSIIVPIYNGEKYIDAFFKCLERQSYKNYEVILVDDGSADGSYETCFKYIKYNDKIKLFKKENGGPGSARNYGIEKASGEYLAFFDIDDEFDRDVIDENITMASKYRADLVIWNFTMVIPGSCKRLYRPIGKTTAVGKDIFFHNFLIATLDNEMFNPPWNKLIRRKLLLDNQIRYHTEYSIYEDILFSYEVCNRAESICINDKSYYTYIIKQGGSLLTKYHPECFKAILSIYDAALQYGMGFANNSREIERFKEQFIYLTRGFIKQICTNKDISLEEKKAALSEIGSNTYFREISRTHDRGFRRIPAKIMMRFRMYGSLIAFYNAISNVKK